MNVERINALADYIEQSETYNQELYYHFPDNDSHENAVALSLDLHPDSHEDKFIEYLSSMLDCGTPACVAGHALFLFREKALDDVAKYKPTFSIEPDTAARLLGITDEEMKWALFDPNPLDDEPVTAEQAVRTLRHLTETGKVDWKV